MTADNPSPTNKQNPTVSICKQDPENVLSVWKMYYILAECYDYTISNVTLSTILTKSANIWTISNCLQTCLGSDVQEKRIN